MDGSATTYRIPGTPEPRPRWVRALVVGGIGVLLVGGAAVLYAVPSLTLSIRTALAVQSVPEELTHASFIADVSEGSRPYRLQDAAFIEDRDLGVLISADARGAMRLVRSDTTYRIIQGSGAVVESTSTLSGVSRSPSGNTIVYAKKIAALDEPAIEAESIPSARVAPKDWILEMLDVRSGRKLELGTGIWPLFLDDQHIFHITPLGMYVFDLPSGSSTRILEASFPHTSLSVLMSPDRTLVGVQDPMMRTVTVYRVSTTSADVVATLPMTERAMSFALGNTDLYILRTSRFGTEVWKESLQGGVLEKVLVLPEKFRITRLLIHTL